MKNKLTYLTWLKILTCWQSFCNIVPSVAEYLSFLSACIKEDHIKKISKENLTASEVDFIKKLFKLS